MSATNYYTTTYFYFKNKPNANTDKYYSANTTNIFRLNHNFLLWSGRIARKLFSSQSSISISFRKSLKILETFESFHSHSCQVLTRSSKLQALTYSFTSTGCLFTALHSIKERLTITKCSQILIRQTSPNIYEGGTLSSISLPIERAPPLSNSLHTINLFLFICILYQFSISTY